MEKKKEIKKIQGVKEYERFRYHNESWRGKLNSASADFLESLHCVSLWRSDLSIFPYKNRFVSGHTTLKTWNL